MRRAISSNPAVTLLVLVMVPFLLLSPANTQARQPDFPEGVRVIASGAQPNNGLDVVHLEEMWRAGGEDDDVIFGHIFRAEADAHGNVYLLDTQLSEVPVFAPDGEHIKTLSREGEGPGETREPIDLTMLPDGTLGIIQRFPGKVVKIDLEGTPITDLFLGDPATGGFNSIYTGRCKGSNLIFIGQSAHQTDIGQNRTWYVGRYDAEGNELARCWSRETILDFSRLVIREKDILEAVVFGSAAGPDDSVYLAPHRDRYVIEVYNSEGEMDHVIERDFSARKRTELESGRMHAVFDFWASQNPGDVETEVEQIAATVSALYVDDSNNLWVENSRSAESVTTGAMLVYDVFDAEGLFDRQVAVVCEGNPVDDQLFRVSDDMIVLVKGSIPAMYASMSGGGTGVDEDKQSMEMEVVCYRIGAK